MVESYDLSGDELSSQIMTLTGTTTGAGGTFALTSDEIVTPQTSFVLPKGATMKMRSRLISGSAVIVYFRFANDGSTFRTLMSDALSTFASFTMGEQDDELRTPHVFRSSNGTEAVQLAWDHAAAGGTFSTVAFDVELIQERL